MANELDAAMQEVMEKLKSSIEEMIIGICKRNLESTATVKQFPIITWYKQMKLFGWEKFHAPTYISITRLYGSREDIGSSNPPAGIIITYMENKPAKSLLGILGALPEEEKQKEGEAPIDPQERILKGCTNLSNIFVDKVRSEIRSLGYGEFVPAPVEHVTQDSRELLSYDQDIKYKYELCFPIRKKESIYLDIVLPRPGR